MSEALAALRHRLKQKALASSITPANSWEGYALILRFAEGVLHRLPTLEELETCDIDATLTTELEELARLVVDLFPRDSFEELATFLVTDEEEKHA